jgi:hypothetical protein
LSTDILPQSPRDSSTPDAGEYASVHNQFADASQSDTSAKQGEARFVFLDSRVGEYAATRVNIARERELEIRERIRKFLQG